MGETPDKPEKSSVGYGQPPERTRFKPGQSGNPRGRPKGSLNMATVLERTLKEKVVVNENGKRKVVSKLEAAVKQLANQAASGQPRAMQLLTTLLRSVEDRAIAAPAPGENLEDADTKVFLGIVKRLETYHKGNEENADEPETT
jgi:Family of unknown function (DUF5681)